MRGSPVRLMWFPLERSFLICWDGAGAQEDTHKPHCWGFGGAATPVGLAALLTAAVCAAACAQQTGFRGGLLSQLFPHFLHREALWNAFTSFHNREGNGLSSQPSFQGLAAAQPVLAPAHRHHKMAPCPAIRLQDGGRARGGWWTVTPGLSTPVWMNIFTFRLAGFPSAVEKLPDWKCWLRVSQSRGYESLGRGGTGGNDIAMDDWCVVTATAFRSPGKYRGRT